MTVAEMLGRISSREISEWQVYEEHEPFGERRMDLRIAMLAHTIANAMGKPKGGGKFKLESFLLDFDRVWADLLAKAPEPNAPGDEDYIEPPVTYSKPAMDNNAILRALIEVTKGLGGVIPEGLGEPDDETPDDPEGE